MVGVVWVCCVGVVDCRLFGGLWRLAFGFGTRGGQMGVVSFGTKQQETALFTVLLCLFVFEYAPTISTEVACHRQKTLFLTSTSIAYVYFILFRLKTWWKTWRMGMLVCGVSWTYIFTIRNGLDVDLYSPFLVRLDSEMFWLCAWCILLLSDRISKRVLSVFVLLAIIANIVLVHSLAPSWYLVIA